MKKSWKKTILYVFIIILLLLISLSLYYIIQTNKLLSEITINETEASAAPKRVNVATDSFNVYITGIDQWDSEKGYDLERSDVNMILTVCPKTRTVLLTSIPRDS